MTNRNEEKQMSNLWPKREKFPMIFNDGINMFTSLSEAMQKDFREREVATIAEQINKLPMGNFTEERDIEIARLIKYYSVFSKLFGVDLVAVARTRMQTSATIMKSSPLFMQTMIDDSQKSDNQPIFFESRLEAGGFQLNATSQNIIEGFSYRFSVLKRNLSDQYGSFEVDYPAISLDRVPVLEVLNWHKEMFPDAPANTNPIFNGMMDLFFLRVHDWFHAAILYDTESTTNIFKKWSDNSFFVKHFFDNPFMINYELLADKTHHLIWQEMFKEDTELKTQIIDKASELVLNIARYEQWANEKNNSESDKHKMVGDYLAYVGLRGLFNVVSFEDEKLMEVLGSSPRYLKVVNSLNPYKEYLNRIYEGIEEIPFRKGSDEMLSMEQIFQEYVDALLEEFRLQKNKSITTEILKLDAETEGYKQIIRKMPLKILKTISESGVDLSEIDPRIFTGFLSGIEQIESKQGKKLKETFVDRTEIDSYGYFYLRVNKNEVETGDEFWSQATHTKEAILVQVPWDFEKNLELSVIRTENLLSKQLGAKTLAIPGEIVLVNIIDTDLAKKIITQSKEDGKFSFKVFWNRLETELARGHQVFGDIYPYKTEKMLNNFEIEKENYVYKDGNLVLTPGVYSTQHKQRRATQSAGPISMDGNNAVERRRILYGAIVNSDTKGEQSEDIFPVDGRSFDRFYTDTVRGKLPHFRFKNSNEELSLLNIELENYLKTLEFLNNIKMYGQRGKPKKLDIWSFVDKIKESDVEEITELR